MAILGFGGMYWAVHGCTVLEHGFTGLYWAKLGYTGLTGLRWLKLVIWLREGCKKSKWKFKMAFAMKGGGSRGGLVCH